MPHDVEILMATYNGERFLSDQIDSIRNQTCQNWRVLISDDCSNDGTLSIISKYAAQDPRFILVSSGQRYGTAKCNFTSLMKNAKAPYVMFCDQDDSWMPNKIQLTLDAMHELEEQYGYDTPLLVFTDMEVVDNNLCRIAPSFTLYSNIDPSRTRFSQVLAQSLGAGCTMMANSSLSKLYKESSNCVDSMMMHDWWLTLIASAFGHIGFVDRPTNKYRQHHNNSLGVTAYSPLKQATRFDEMKKSQNQAIIQAGAFADMFSERLTTEQRETLYCYCKIAKSSGVVAIRYLFKSGCWKKGLRKVGQVAVSFSGIAR